MEKFTACFSFCFSILYFVGAISKPSLQPQCSGTKEEVAAAMEILKNVKIHNGVVADFDNFKFLVGIEIKGEYKGIGSIISDCVLITAAHVVYGVDKNEIIVSIGSPALMGGKKMKIINVETYRKYKREGDIFEYDVAVMQTDGPINCNDNNCETILLPEKDVFMGSVFHVAGWGATTPESEPSNVLLTSNFKSIDEYKCREQSRQSWNKSYLCTVPAKNPDAHTCPGDSGTSLVKRKRNGKKYIYGVLSHGSHECNSPFGVDVFTDMLKTDIMEWIKTYMAKISRCDNSGFKI